MMPAPLVAEPAGQADMQVQVEGAVEGVALGGEAVGHGVADVVAPGAEHLPHAPTRVPLVDEERLAAGGGDLQLGLEGVLLLRRRGEVAVEVEPALAHGHHLGLALQGRHGRGELAVPTDRKSTRLNSSHVRISYAV